eukprot:12319753-Prorocentrum_lima.AAC.1
MALWRRQKKRRLSGALTCLQRQVLHRCEAGDDGFPGDAVDLLGDAGQARRDAGFRDQVVRQLDGRHTERLHLRSRPLKT